MLEIHFYQNEARIPEGRIPCHGWDETERAVAALEPMVVTTQMGLLSTRLVTESGYRVFVHPAEGDGYEISLDGKCACTDKELRPAHNLFRMWQAGAFRAPERPVKEA